MRAQEFENPKEKFVDMFRKFLPLAMEVIELNSLPKFVFDEKLDTGEQPSFGAYSVDNQTLYVALANRHPNDILRTVAHELVHYKQDTINELNDESGITGSPEENQANQIAGIVMRNFNKRYPEFLSSKPVVLESRQGNENISEKLNRTGSNELVIFDIDDTLLHTTAQIKVIKDGVPVRSLTNQEFNNYKLGPGEEFDFGEFRNAQKFEEESVPIGPMLDKLKQDLAAGKNVVMLTARSDFDNQKAVWRTFKRHGIDINQDVHLFRAGNLPGSESPAVKKAIHVSKWLNTGNYRKIVMYDDSEKNLTVFKSLETKFPDVEFEAHHVSDEGSTRQVEERKKKKIRHAAYGPGPYGWYGYDAGYSGDSGGIEEGQYEQEAEKYRAQLIKTLPHMMKFLDQAVKGWSPSEEQMMAAIDTAYNVMKLTGNIKQAGKAMMDELNTLHRMSQNQQGMSENFADGRNPQDKGDSARHGIRKGMSIAQLKKVRSSKTASPRKKQLAHWQINMRQGRKK
jgi:hypothetical protein